ncbi:hypothetical protein D9611_009337 [Ephemerocybe angulata]|uniref:Uncharacterized protein n=1 Tax=Ephemerocybe angulata TaxID=980116 RepID=A0A8H5F459_9AGAR|nr:hypothetical protein D9611_009337 [Tulosesus angulatus]
MATAAVLSYSDAEQIMATWAKSGGPTDEEKIKFADEALALLADDDMAAKFQDNVKQVGVWANQIDASFDRVTRSFADMVAKYGSDFPGFAAYNTEWIGYNKKWVAHLSLSRDVASEHVVILRRFDKIFLDMVESIETDQDRKDVIVELQQFIDEKHDRSTEMQNNFLNLKRDIEDFVLRLDKFIYDKGVELAAAAAQLKIEIDGLQGEISVLDAKIKDATIALAVTGACLSIIGLIVAGSVLAAFESERNGKQKALRGKQADLADVNRKQEALAQLQSDFDNVKPDITLICEKLVLFAEIWSSVRSQTVQFQEHLKSGMDALTNMRFKKEVRLAREMCAPLQAGLEKYATELENRAATK